MGWTAYGMHLAIVIIMASFLGDDTPDTPECNTVSVPVTV
jgi:hypothetical protein